ncbi:MAG: hypothetical protein ACKOVH_01225 [Actinomycetota bacterium]
MERPDLDLDALTPLEPDDARRLITDPAHRRRTREFAVLLEMCRHPLDDAQVTRTDAYAAAIDESGPGLDMVRHLVREGKAAALADRARFNDYTADWSEPSLVQDYLKVLDAPDPELAERVRALRDLPAGTLGREFVEFYDRYGITLPGDEVNIPAFFIGHDMNHVIAGYGTTGPAEIALSAMLLAIDDSDAHWALLLVGFAAYELGITESDPSSFQAKERVLDRPGAAEMLAEAFHRGALCTGDFSVVDKLPLAHLPLEEVRAMFGVPPLVGQSE